MHYVATLAAVLGLAGTAAFAAPSQPTHDVWIEGESSQDHDFTVIGTEAAFEPCYGAAILQLQTQQEAPAGGYHATYTVSLPDDGWWDLQLAITKPDGQGLSPFWVEATGYRNREMRDIAGESTYGPGNIFTWINAGRFHFRAGANNITIRCTERRASEGDYLVYLDALALQSIPAPSTELAWIAGDPTAQSWHLRALLAPAEPVSSPGFSVICDGSFEAFLDGVSLGRGEGWYRAAWLRLPDETFSPGKGILDLVVEPQPGGGVLAWVEGLGHAGAKRRLVPTGTGAWQALGPEGLMPVRVLGSAVMQPYGDMEVQPPHLSSVGKLPIPVKTGNLSVELIRAAATGQPAPTLGPRDFLTRYRDQAGISVVEDYICWAPMEPEKGRFQWDEYLENAQQLSRRGMSYALYPWLHVIPAWARSENVADSPLCLTHGQPTDHALSIWSPKTFELFDRLYGEMHAALGEYVAQVFVGMTADYGEVGYPIGMASWLIPSDHIHPDFWCGDTYARADFRSAALALYGSLEGINRAWGTDWQAVAEITYPPQAQAARSGDDYVVTAPLECRRWLDFVEWYQAAMVHFAGQVVGISRRHFGDLPHEVKIGFGAERAEYGADFTAYVKQSRTAGYTVRSTHGKLPLYFYRRFSSAAKHYGVGLVTEPPSDVSRHEEVTRIFKDATSGTTEYFDYPPNLLGASDILARFGRFMEGHHSLTSVAFFFPTSDQRLRAGQTNPGRLVAATEQARDRFDWDIVDERLIRDGALERYRVLILVEGHVIEASVLADMQTWVENGGLLLAARNVNLQTVEGDDTWNREQLAAATDLADRDEVVRTSGTPEPEMRVDVGSPGDGAALTGTWYQRESGHWEWGGEPDAIRKRWSGARAGIQFPARPDTSYVLRLVAAKHPKQLTVPCRISVNGHPLGTLADTRTSDFRAEIPGEWVEEGMLTVWLDTESWKPSIVDGSNDQRELGVAVRSVALWETGRQESTAVPAPQFSTSLSLDALRRGLQRIGKGATLRLPIDNNDLKRLNDCLTVAIYRTDELMPTATAMPLIDGKADGLWTAIMPQRILLCNPTDGPISRVLNPDPAAMARLGVQWSAPEPVTIEVAAHAIAAVELPTGRIVQP